MANPTSVTSTQVTTVIANPISGDYRIDVLLESASERWNAGSALGTAVEVTYSFMAAAPTYASNDDKAGFSVFTPSQKAAVTQILTQISQQFGISFRLVEDTATSYGQLRFGNNDQGDTSAGFAYLPNSTQSANDGDLYINNKDPSQIDNVVPSSYAWSTLVHEIGHALGLKHPGNYNAGEAASTDPGNFLAASEDSEANTVMSYVKTPQDLERDFYAKYDFLALKYLYGVRSFNADATTYSFSDTADRLQIINDSGGIDTIDVSKATAGARIDLREGGSSSIGRITGGAAAQDNVTIAYGVTIENVIGTALNDTITGNAAANIFTGGAGNDVIDGGSGIDTSVYRSARSVFAVTPGSTTVIVAGGTDGSDTLTGIERLQFTDSWLALDIDGNAGKVAKVLGAVFGAASVSIKEYVGIGLGLLDSGMSYEDLMKLALNTRLGNGYTNSAEITLLYQNLVGVTPSANDIAPWSNAISAQQYTQASLAIMAADTPYNTGNIKLVGLASTGIAYIHS